MPLPWWQVTTGLITAGMLVACCCSPPCLITRDRAIDGAPPPPRETGAGTLTTVPDVLQGRTYSCAASSLQAVIRYWGGNYREEELLRMLNTTEGRGTPPREIVSVATTLGFAAEMRTDIPLSVLESAIRAGIPVIVGIRSGRAGSSSPLWADDRYFGHYVVVIGMDDENVFLEDPAVLGSRKVVPRDEFLAQWRDLAAGDIRDPDTLTLRRVAVFISGPVPQGPFIAGP